MSWYTSMSILAESLHGPNCGQPIFLPLKIVSRLCQSDIDDLCRRLKATGSAPFLVVRDDAEFDRSSFSGVVTSLEWGKLRVEVIDPQPEEFEVALCDEDFGNLFDVRR